MLIEIDPCAADDESAHGWLDRILYKIEDGWHVWDTTRQADPDKIMNTSWIRGSAQRVKELLVASIQRSAWTLDPHGRSVRVTASPSAPDELMPEDAAQLAAEPLCIR